MTCTASHAIEQLISNAAAKPTGASSYAALAHGPIGVRTEGQLSADERIEYKTYVQALKFIAVLQAQARSLLTNSYV
jgi:hypothetical protein